MTPKPSSRGVDGEFAAPAAGVRCALMTRASTGMPSSLSVPTAFSTTGQSESLPIITATFLLIHSLSSKKDVKVTAKIAVTLQL